MNLIMRRNCMADDYQPPVCNNTAYAMLNPPVGSYAGKLYLLNLLTGELTRKKNYYMYYFTSMEYANGTWYGYLNDLDEGFGTIDFANGTYEFTQIKAVRRNMTDMTYNHYNGKMYGLSYGLIYEVNLEDGTATPVTVPTGTPKFIAIAAYGGDLYVMEQFNGSNTGPHGLYRFPGCDFTRLPELIMTIGIKPQYTQSMAFAPGDRILYWASAKNKTLYCIDLRDLHNPVIVSANVLAQVLTGLVIL